MSDAHHRAGRVLFDFEGIRDSNPSRQAIGDLVLRQVLWLTCSFQNGGRDWHIRAWIRPEDVPQAEALMKAYRSRYIGRTYFCWGSICGVYETPADELADRPSDRFLRHQRGECPCGPRKDASE